MLVSLDFFIFFPYHHNYIFPTQSTQHTFFQMRFPVFAIEEEKIAEFPLPT